MMRSKRFGILPVLAVLVMALLACKKNKEGEKTESTSSASSGNEVGVPECDEYLTKYEKCVSEKVPEAARPQLKSTVDTMRSTWKQQASNPVAKAGLAQGCKQALEAAKTAMGSYGCTW
jgi:hypothetical protein